MADSFTYTYGNKATTSEETNLTDTSAIQNKRGICGYWSFDGKKEVRGVGFGGIARGAINMSNVYLANALIHLACKASGGFDETGTRCVNPDINIYGMKPNALISNIAVAASVLSALMMPVFGAVIDYTPHRKWLGIGTAAGLAIISGVQMATLDDTWFIMAILQAIVFMIYQIQLMALFAYFPEIARDYGEEKMTVYSSQWSGWQFFAQAAVNFVIILTSYFGRLGTVNTSMFSQGIVALVCVIFLSMCWSSMPQRPRMHRLPTGRSLIVAGFRQNYITFKKIWNNYGGLRWFFLSTIFSEASASAVGSTAVIFLTGNLKLSALQIGIFFEVSLIGVFIGTMIGAYATKRTNPKVSLILSELGLALAVVIGVWAVQGARVKELTYMWGFSIGIFLGWFYPTENVFFSLSVPPNQEAELSGFYGYCSQIFGWFPPLVFSIMVQKGISLAWALTVVASIFTISVFFLLLCGSWDGIVEEAKAIKVDFTHESRGFELSAATVGHGRAEENGDNNKNENTEEVKVDSC